MQVTPIALLIVGLLLLIGLRLGAPITVALFASFAFGATAIMTLPGGAPLLLFVPLAAALVARTLLARHFWRNLSGVIRLGWTPAIVLILLLYVDAGALVMPRLFAGVTTVFVPSGGAIVETALRPVSGNLNQAAYFTLGTFAFFAMATRLMGERRFELLKLGFLSFAIAHISLGLIDFAGKTVGAGDILAPIRTAGYSMLTEVQVLNFWRITGGLSEASAFGSVCVSLLAFCFSYWRRTGWLPALALSVVLALLTVMSTSSTAYVSLMVLALCLGASYAWQVMLGRFRFRDVSAMFGGAALLAAFLGLSALSADSLAPIQELFDATVTHKASSGSASERFYWNEKSIDAFFDTGGVGIGIGSSRASSSAVAVLSQLGAFGATLLVLLLADMLRPIPRPTADPAAIELAAVVGSLRTTGFAVLIPASIAGGGADPGIVFFIAVAGVLVGRNQLRQLTRATALPASHGRPATGRPSGPPLPGDDALARPPAGDSGSPLTIA